MKPKFQSANGDISQSLPSNLDAERSVLGAVLLDNAALLPAREWIQPSDFFLTQHNLVFYQMLEMHNRGAAIDLVTLTEELHKHGELEAVGGAPYLASLGDGMPRVSNVAYYAGIVKEKALLRNLIHCTHQIQERAFSGEDDAEVVLANAKTSLSALLDTQNLTGFVPVKVIVRDNFETLEKIFSEGRHVTGVPTGYTRLDNLLTGLQPGELTILAARPSVGKSALALNIAENVSLRSARPVAIASLEMSKHSLLLRLVASVAQIDAHKFLTGHLSREDWRRITETLATIAGAPLWIDDASTLTVGQIGARAERLCSENHLSLLIVDYLQLVAGSKKYGNRQEEVSDISRSLKALAKDLQIPVMALSQLKRNGDREDRQPQLSDLRESGQIEQDADVVLFIHRPHLYRREATQEEREETDVIVGKQRNGPTDTVKFVFRSWLTRFEEAAPDMFGESL